MDLSKKNDNETILLKALRTNDKTTLSKVLSENPFFVSIKMDSKKQTLLHCATEENNTEMIEYLVKNGANVNSKNCYSELTPFLLACQKGRYEASLCLLKLGADLTAKDLKGNSPIHLCLGKYEKGETFGTSKRKIIEYLLLCEIDINCKKPNGMIPLHLACEHGSSEECDFLLKNKSRVNVKDLRGNTPLIYAIKSKSIDCVKMLLAHDCDLKIINDKKYSIFHYLVASQDIKLFNLFDTINIDILKETINSQDQIFEYSPMHIACLLKNLEIVSKLLSLNANPNLQCKNGDTPLHIVAKLGDVNLAKLFLSNRPLVRINIRNGNKKTAKNLLLENKVFTDICEEFHLFKEECFSYGETNNETNYGKGFLEEHLKRIRDLFDK